MCGTCNDEGIEHSGVCHCGEDIDRHTYGNSNHSAVEMERYCPDCDAGKILALVDSCYEEIWNKTILNELSN